MQREDDTADTLLEAITRELTSIIGEGSEECATTTKEEEKNSQSIANESEICCASTSSLKGNTSLTKDEIFSKNAALNTTSITSVNDSIQSLQTSLDESCKTFEAVAESFKNINFGSLKNRIKDLHLNETCSGSLKLIVDDLRQSFDEKYVESRLADLTRKVSSKFRNHSGEFGDIPEISEFFRTCSRLEHGLVKLKQQRDDCLYLQKRMFHAAEASYDRVNAIQQKIREENEEQQDER